MTQEYDLVFGIYRMVPKIQLPKDTCIPMLTERHFTVAANLETTQVSKYRQLIKKYWYIYSMEYYSAIDKMKGRTEGIVQWKRDLSCMCQPRIDNLHLIWSPK